MTRIAGIIFTLLFAVNLFGQERYLRPIDEGRADAGFAAFRAKLIDAVERRDEKYVLSIVDRDIRVTFGDNHGLADFKQMWKLSDPNDRFWTEFLVILNGGGKFERTGKGRAVRTQFWAPYVFAAYPEDLDPFDTTAITGENVNLRKRPDKAGAIVARLSYNLVKVDHARSVPGPTPESEPAWFHVETFGGKKGYVLSEFTRSPVGLRAGFTKKQGKWMLTTLIAGD